MAERDAKAVVKTTCPYCGVGCGVDAAVGGGAVTIAGDRGHPANAGRLCVKGAALGETLGLDDRLLAPQARAPGGGGFAEITWPDAIERVAGGFADAIRDHGPDSVAFYVSGQLTTEDYYVANKLMKGFIGSANIDTNSRLCMASSVAGHKRVFGADVVPGVYDDFDEADLIVLVGSNLAWCHPVLQQRIAAAQKARPALKVVAVDPRRTATADWADSHLAIAPGGDVALFQGLLARILARGAVDHGYVAAHTEGFAAAAAAAEAASAGLVEETGLDAAALSAFYDQWIDAPRVVSVYSQGVNQWSTGVDKVSAILNCHLATGRIGRPGMGPFSVTGQPNAMGGREVGGLSTVLAAHMALEDAGDRARVRRFWNAPRVASRPGLKAVDLFKALGAGRIKALWVMATNPAVSLPEADAVAAAIETGAMVVVSDIAMRTDTARRAQILLPALGWGEKDGSVTNSERRISRQRAFLPAPGAARADWRIVCDVAGAIGEKLGEDWASAFDYAHPSEIFREHAALSGYDNEAGARAFDISAYADLSRDGYERLEPFLWPAPRAKRAEPRLYAAGGFHHPNGRARFAVLAPKPLGEALSADYPLILNTGRVRDQWHTMTRTAKSPRLSRHIAEPFVEIHPADAAGRGVCANDVVLLESRLGAMLARAVVTDKQRQGSVFAPMHWTSETASQARVDALVSPVVDPVSGQPESKRTPARISRFTAAWHGFAVTRAEPWPATRYWAKARTEHGWRVELAHDAALEDAEAFARSLLGGAGEMAILDDAARGVRRFALFDGARALGALFIAPEPLTVAREWLATALGDATPRRFELLAGRAGGAGAADGPALCVCENVGVGAVARTIAEGAGSVDAVGRACAAGTTCGSCRPEIKAMIAAARAGDAVAAE